MECPDCKSTSVQSKGYRTKGVHRYLCNNCGRNFTVDNRPKIEELPEKIQEEVISAEAGAKFDREQWTKNYHEDNTTITIPREVKDWLVSLKNYDKEPIASVIIRIKNKQVIL